MLLDQNGGNMFLLFGVCQKLLCSKPNVDVTFQVKDFLLIFLCSPLNTEGIGRVVRAEKDR